MTKLIPEGHKYAHFEDAFVQAMSQTWNAIAPGEKDFPGLQASIRALVFGGHIREFGGLTPEQLRAWEDLVTGGHKQLAIARKIAKSVI